MNSTYKSSQRFQTLTSAEALRAMKQPERQLQGKQANLDGHCFEDIISASCGWYYDQKLAHIEKTPEPMKVLRPLPGKKNQFAACFVKQAQPDYKGTLRDGQAVVFEAKYTGADRIERSRLTTVQAEGLEMHNRLGACTFVLIAFDFRDYFRIPWEMWRDMKQRFGRLYIKPEEIGEHRVEYVGGLVRFLDGIV